MAGNDSNIGQYFYGEQLDLINKSIFDNIFANEILIKLLWYNTSDALSLSNVSEKNKYAMIDQTDYTNTRIFDQRAPYVVENNKRSELRFFLYEIYPENTVLAKVCMGFQIIIHKDKDVWHLDDGNIRLYKIYQELLKTFNGKEVSGIGDMIFLRPQRIESFGEFFDGFTLFGQTRVT